MREIKKVNGINNKSVKKVPVNLKIFANIKDLTLSKEVKLV
jgi:hypothetical protein